MKCHVEITETLSRVIDVEAVNENEAEQKVREQYRLGDIVLGGDDCVDMEIKIL